MLLQDFPVELLRQILGYLPEDDLHNACAASLRILESSPDLVYSSGQALLGKRSANGVRTRGDQERYRRRIMLQLAAPHFGCRSLTILADERETSTSKALPPSRPKDLDLELSSRRLRHLLTLIERHKPTLTGLHIPFCPIPDLNKTLSNLPKLQELSIRALPHADLNLPQLSSLRKLTVFHRANSYGMVAVANLPRLKELTLHFDTSPWTRSTGMMGRLVNLSTLPCLQSLDLFAGSRSSKTRAVPLSFLHGRSDSIVRARLCGPFELSAPQCWLTTLTTLGPALEVLSLARLRFCTGPWPLQPTSPRSRASLPKLRALELHDISLSTMRCDWANFPSLEKLVITSRDVIDIEHGVPELLRHVGDNLRSLSIISMQPVNPVSSYDLIVSEKAVSEILRCLHLDSLILYGPYHFRARDWRTLANRALRSMATVHIQYPCQIRPPPDLACFCVTDYLKEAIVPGLTTVDSRTVIRTPTLDDRLIWPPAERGGERRRLLRQLRRTDPEGDLSFTAGDFFTTCTTLRQDACVRKRVRMYSRPVLFTDTSWINDSDVIEISDDEEVASCILEAQSGI